jgi:pimeloyl-ACP methyl ester carboxylesterase
MAAFFRRIQQFVRDQPIAAALAGIVFVVAVVAAAVAVASDGSDDGTDTAGTVAPTTTTTSAPTTVAPTTTEAPTGTTAPANTTTAAPPSGTRCVVRLHGKGGDGADTWYVDDVAYVSPTGNASGWGGRQWMYFPDDQYERAVEVVAEAIDSEDCGPVIINGFSNGGAFAAKLYCNGETFGGRVIRVVVDDPVVDTAVEGCDPAPTVDVTLYWTGALEGTARPGWNCREEDWTCEGGRTIGIDAYAAALDTAAQPSRYDGHNWYEDAPELSEW